MLLSVRLMTYNHSAKITECLESIEKQQTSFPFEVVIGDDFSTDHNLELIRKFISSSKNEKITYVLLDRKRGDDYDVVRQEKGRLYNFVNIIDNCQGKYIALLDGDDYWIDPLKLQKQVDVLEQNEQVSLVYTNAEINSENGGDYADSPTFYEKEYPTTTIQKQVDVLEQNEQVSLVYTNAEINSENGGDYADSPTFYEKEYPTTTIQKQAFYLKNNYRLLVVTVMFRKKDFDTQVKETMLEFATGDFALYFMLSGKGDFYYINECSSVYFDHGLGESKKFSKLKRDRFNYSKMNLLTSYIKPENKQLFNQYQHRYLIRSVFNIMFRKVKKDGLEGIKFSQLFFVKPQQIKARYFYYYLKLVLLKIIYTK